MTEARRCEIQAEGGWRPWAFPELETGMIYRLFEPSGEAVVDEVTGARRWRVLGPRRMTAEGVLVLESETLEESEVEQAVREQGMFWPGETKPWVEGTGRRLRG